MAADTVAAYLDALPRERREPVGQTVEAIRAAIDPGFEEIINYGMPSWVVPHSVYPDGYHSSPKLPVPFMSVANQKQHIGVYSMGMYGSRDVLDWFAEQYAALDLGALNRGKGCVRFTKMDQIPYGLIGELAAAVSLEQYLAHYASVDPRNS